jgi:hypothetical protein
MIDIKVGDSLEIMRGLDSGSFVLAGVFAVSGLTGCLWGFRLGGLVGAAQRGLKRAILPRC